MGNKKETLPTPIKAKRKVEMRILIQRKTLVMSIQRPGKCGDHPYKDIENVVIIHWKI
jgi:hypothetical protein